MLLTQPSCVVLLAAYHGLAWISDQVESVLAQQGVLVTLYISVDASTDGTEQFCDELAKKDPRVRILPHGLVFGGASKNFYRLMDEVDLTGFDYLALADQDDVWLENKLAQAIHKIQTENVAAYSSNVTAFWADGRTLLINKAQKQTRYDFLFEAAGPGCTYVLTQTLALDLKKSIQNQRNDINQIDLHDWFFYAHARARGYLWFIDSQPFILYRQHAKNQFGVNKGLAAMKKRLEKVRSGWFLKQSLNIATVIGYQNHPFVQQWRSLSPLGLLALGLQAYQCRRRYVEKIAFFGFCCMLALDALRQN